MLSTKLKEAAGNVSSAGVNWTAQTDLAIKLSSNTLQCMAWDGSKFVALSNNGSIATSPDGITWTKVTLSAPLTSAAFVSVVWSGSLFVAVGYNAGVSAVCATSSNGTTWTYQSGLNTAWAVGWNPWPYAVAWNGSLFCAAGPGGKCVTSPDGITWTSRSGFTTAFTINGVCNAITNNGSLFVAVGYDSSTSLNICATSTDGITWTTRSSFTTASGAAGYNPYDVNWNGSLFCAVGDICLTSPDGITWIKRNSFTAVSGGVRIESVTWDGSLFCAVGGSGTCVTSSDAVTWTKQSGFTTAFGSTFAAYAVASNSSKLVAVGQTGKCATSP